MNGQQIGQPIFILSEGSKRTRGSEAQNNNIMAAKAVAEAVRTTLGPKGMDKMLVDSMGDVIITNDGAAILKEMDIEHPAAKMIVEISKTQDSEVGDGTTTAAVLAGELLSKAESLLEEGVHPTVIASGYILASEKANEIVKNMALTVTPENKDILKKIAETAITGKGAEFDKEKLAELTVDAALSIIKKLPNGKINADTSKIKVEKRAGGSISDSIMIDGVLIDKERVHPNMPTKIEDAKILLLSIPIEYKKTEAKSEIKITSPEQMMGFIEQEESMLKEIINKVIVSGANVVFCQKGIDDLAQYYMAKAGILGARRIKQSDMNRLAEATGAKIITNINEISDIDIGKAGVVEEKETNGSKMIYVTKCSKTKNVSLLLREGIKGPIELPGLFGNILSYCRIYAVGLSSIYIASTVNTIAFEMIWSPSSGFSLMTLASILMFVIGHLLNTCLSIIAPGLHALRLQYVEFFGKFYSGGGKKYSPFGHIRKYTKE